MKISSLLPNTSKSYDLPYVPYSPNKTDNAPPPPNKRWFDVSQLKTRLIAVTSGSRHYAVTERPPEPPQPSDRRLGFPKAKVHLVARRLLAHTDDGHHDDNTPPTASEQTFSTPNNSEFGAKDVRSSNAEAPPSHYPPMSGDHKPRVSPTLHDADPGKFVPSASSRSADGPKASVGPIRSALKTVGDAVMSAVPGTRKWKAKKALKETLEPITERIQKFLIAFPEITSSFETFKASQEPNAKGGYGLRPITSFFDLVGMKNVYSQNIEAPGELGEIKKLFREARKKSDSKQDDLFEKMLRDVARWGSPSAYQGHPYVEDSDKFKNEMAELDKNMRKLSAMLNVLCRRILGGQAPTIKIPR